MPMDIHGELGRFKKITLISHSLQGSLLFLIKQKPFCLIWGIGKVRQFQNLVKFLLQWIWVGVYKQWFSRGGKTQGIFILFLISQTPEYMEDTQGKCVRKTTQDISPTIFNSWNQERSLTFGDFPSWEELKAGIQNLWFGLIRHKRILVYFPKPMFPSIWDFLKFQDKGRNGPINFPCLFYPIFHMGMCICSCFKWGHPKWELSRWCLTRG